MKQMDLSTEQVKKPKLPRKRKKAAIKAQGRDWYLNTIRLYQITQKSWLSQDENVRGENPEPVCKFWVNSSIRPHVFLTANGEPYQLMLPTKYW